MTATWDDLGREAARKANAEMNRRTQEYYARSTNDVLREIVDVIKSIDSRLQKIEILLSQPFPKQNTDGDELMSLKSQVFNLRERVKIYKIHEDKVDPDKRIY